MAALWIELSNTSSRVYFFPCKPFCSCIYTSTLFMNPCRFFLMRAMTSAANTTCWVLSSPSSESASMKTLWSPWKPGRRTSICGLSDLSWTRVGFKDKMVAITSILDMGDFILITLVPLLPARGTEGFFIWCSSWSSHTESHTGQIYNDCVRFWKISCGVSVETALLWMTKLTIPIDTLKLTNQPNTALVKLFFLFISWKRNILHNKARPMIDFFFFFLIILHTRMKDVWIKHT